MIWNESELSNPESHAADKTTQPQIFPPFFDSTKLERKCYLGPRSDVEQEKCGVTVGSEDFSLAI
jgi:hypothetical protein